MSCFTKYLQEQLKQYLYLMKIFDSRKHMAKPFKVCLKATSNSELDECEIFKMQELKTNKGTDLGWKIIYLLIT